MKSLFLGLHSTHVNRTLPQIELEASSLSFYVFLELKLLSVAEQCLGHPKRVMSAPHLQAHGLTRGCWVSAWFVKPGSQHNPKGEGELYF